MYGNDSVCELELRKEHANRHGVCQQQDTKRIFGKTNEAYQQYTSWLKTTKALWIMLVVMVKASRKKSNTGGNVCFQRYVEHSG